MARDIKFEKSVGVRIRDFRKELGWSQQNLADEANIERRQLQRIEKAEHSTSLNAIVQIARALGKQPYELLKTDYKLKGN